MSIQIRKENKIHFDLKIYFKKLKIKKNSFFILLKTFFNNFNQTFRFNRADLFQ